MTTALSLAAAPRPILAALLAHPGVEGIETHSARQWAREVLSLIEDDAAALANARDEARMAAYREGGALDGIEDYGERAETLDRVLMPYRRLEPLVGEARDFLDFLGPVERGESAPEGLRRWVEYNDPAEVDRRAEVAARHDRNAAWLASPGRGRWND